MAEGEIARFEQFLLLSLCFQKAVSGIIFLFYVKVIPIRLFKSIKCVRYAK